MAPVPPHLSQATVLLILSFFVTPLAISARVSLTRTRMSEPRFTWRAPPPPDERNPPPKWPPKMSPNCEKMSSIENPPPLNPPKPPAPPPAAPLIPAWPNWSYRARLSGFDNTS